ncbi:MAG: response regulator transcription factor, partial [Clostridia bacterium]|nr:response regulator transcription factor [Clostridia bacterium]
NVREVEARIKAILRRVTPEPKGDSSKTMVSGDITLDYNFRRAMVLDGIVELTGKEFDLLELFLKNPDKVYTRENLLDILWGIGYPSEERTIDVHMRRLREKIEDNPAEPKYLKTKWGVGYYYKVEQS